VGILYRRISTDKDFEGMQNKKQSKLFGQSELIVMVMCCENEVCYIINMKVMLDNICACMYLTPLVVLA